MAGNGTAVEPAKNAPGKQIPWVFLEGGKSNRGPSSTPPFRGLRRNVTRFFFLRAKRPACVKRWFNLQGAHQATGVKQKPAGFWSFSYLATWSLAVFFLCQVSYSPEVETNSSPLKAMIFARRSGFLLGR